MYKRYYSKRFQKSFNKILRSGKIKQEEIETVVNLLATGKNLGPEYKDHVLHGEYADCRECHIRGNILLIYKIEKEMLILILVNIGTHPELFG